jgi:ABC-type spermidine/putrescine transport system permease subunit II
MTRLAVRFVAVVGFLVLIAPLVAVVANAFNADEILSGWGGFTTRWSSRRCWARWPSRSPPTHPRPCAG